MECNCDMESFTIIIPVYNEEELIEKNTEKLVNYLDQLKTPYEIIIGSNGSTDRTCELGLDLAKRYPQIKFFHLAEKGPGHAVKKAVLLSSHPNIISVDMDLSVDLGFIKMANKLLSEFDLVVGSKRMGSQKRTPLRKVASASFIFCSMIFLGLSFDDYSLAAKGYKRKVLEGCLDRIEGGTFYVIEVLNFAVCHNFTTVEIPAPCEDNRISRFNLLNEGFYRFGKLFHLWVKQHWKGLGGKRTKGPPQKNRGSRENLEKECKWITQYLVSEIPSSENVQRYIQGHSCLLESPQPNKDLAITAYVRRFPWSLPYLDAVCGLFHPHCLLRKKILLMVAILEASPRYTSYFLPEAVSFPRFLISMMGYGLKSMVKVFFGCFLYPFVGRGR